MALDQHRQACNSSDQATSSGSTLASTLPGTDTDDIADLSPCRSRTKLRLTLVIASMLSRSFIQRSPSAGTVSNASSKKDLIQSLSAREVANHEKSAERASIDYDSHPPLEPVYPLPLVVFVLLLSILAGVVVTGVHLLIVYAGCPLGINGCNSFNESKESKGFFLVRWFMHVTRDQVPEHVIYIATSILGALLISTMFACVPEPWNFQIRGGGTVQALVSVANGERILLSAAGLRLLATSIYLGSGGTLGMDGPAIQICTAATTFVGYSMGMRSVPTQSLLSSMGFAAGFAATFNSPLAGVMFAMEELQHVSSRLSKHIMCVLLMASIVATLVTRALLGNRPLLDTEWDPNLIQSVAGGSFDDVIGTKMWMLVSVPIAVLCCFAGWACSRLLRMGHHFVRAASAHGVPEPVIFVGQAALVACIGSAVFSQTGLRGVWGIGYESLQQAFARDFRAADYLVVAGGKLFAFVLAVVVRAPGDLLEPVLLVGAFLGGTVAAYLQEVIQDADLANQVMKPCLVFGIVAFFASIFRFPLTPVVIVLELLGAEAYSLLLPAALSSFTAITISNRLFPSFMEEIMHADGIDLIELSENSENSCDFIQNMFGETSVDPGTISLCDSSRSPRLSTDLSSVLPNHVDRPSFSASAVTSSGSADHPPRTSITISSADRNRPLKSNKTSIALSSAKSSSPTRKDESPAAKPASVPGANLFSGIEDAVLSLSSTHAARKRRSGAKSTVISAISAQSKAATTRHTWGLPDRDNSLKSNRSNLAPPPPPLTTRNSEQRVASPLLGRLSRGWANDDTQIVAIGKSTDICKVERDPDICKVECEPELTGQIHD